MKRDVKRSHTGSPKCVEHDRSYLALSKIIFREKDERATEKEAAPRVNRGTGNSGEGGRPGKTLDLDTRMTSEGQWDYTQRD